MYKEKGRGYLRVQGIAQVTCSYVTFCNKIDLINKYVFHKLKWIMPQILYYFLNLDLEDTPLFDIMLNY